MSRWYADMMLDDVILTIIYGLLAILAVFLLPFWLPVWVIGRVARRLLNE